VSSGPRRSRPARPTSAVTDAIANILHHLAYEFPDEDAEVVVESALEHFRHEIDDRD
jgi:hypothetical protein